MFVTAKKVIGALLQVSVDFFLSLGAKETYCKTVFKSVQCSFLADLGTIMTNMHLNQLERTNFKVKRVGEELCTSS